VRKLVLASASYRLDGLHPGVLDGIQTVQPEMFKGTPFYNEYMSINPHPENWPRLIEKIKQLDAHLPEWTAEQIRSIQAPVFLVIGDSDIVRPEHAVEMFRLLGGGVPGDNAGLPKSRLAVLPGTTHITLPARATWLAPMIDDFLNAK
jgi:pimeloyl-ACP methyl ester carboxylesterase